MALNLPGADFYITKAKETFSWKFNLGFDVEKEALDLLVEDALDESDAQAMVTLITYQAGWSAEEASDFFREPQHRPYKSKLEFSEDPQEKRKQYLTIGRYLKLDYEQAAEGEEKEAKGSLLRAFFDCTLVDLFDPQELALKDKIFGIDQKERAEGDIKPNPEVLELMEETAERLFPFDNEKSRSLHEKMVQATEGGHLSLIDTYLRNYKGEPVVRKALEMVLTERFNDQKFIEEKLQLLWQAETYREEMGISLDLYYQLSGFPEPDKFSQEINNFHTFSKLGLLAHLEEEAPGYLRAAKKSESEYLLSYEGIQRAIAEQDMPVSQAELKEKVRETEEKLKPYLGLRESSPFYVVQPAIRIGSDQRPCQISWYNQEHQLVTFSSVSPRIKWLRYLQTNVHEITHANHLGVLAKVNPVAVHTVQGAIKEEIAMLVESQIRIIFGEFQPKLTHSDVLPPLFDDLTDAVLKIRQGPYAQIQALVRQKMAELRHGRVDKNAGLTTDEIQKLVESVKGEAKNFYSQTEIDYGPLEELIPNINIANPLDGAVYIRDLIKGSGKKKRGQTLNQAFEERFKYELPLVYSPRNDWLADPDAGILLWGLMIETASEHNLDKLAEYVKKADIQEIKTKLLQLGILEEKV